MTTRQTRRAAERAERKRTRAEINRENARKSTGPKTAAGKAASRQNAFKHGLYAQQVAIKKEDAAALDALKADLRAQHQPANDTEEILVNELAEQFWRIKRARVFEANIFDAPAGELAPLLAAVQRLMSSAERGMYKSITTLRQLQKDRGFVPQESEIAEPEQLTPPEPPEPIVHVAQKAPNPTVFTRSASPQPAEEPLATHSGSVGGAVTG